MILLCMAALEDPCRQAHVLDQFATPDHFRQPSDGDDDAPGINRAIAALAGTRHRILKFLPRVYHLRTAVVQSNASIAWQGDGWTERFDPQVADGGNVGTWLVVEPAGRAAITITGAGSRGSSIAGIGIVEPQPPVTAGRTWSPRRYDYVFDVRDTYGAVSFSHVMFMAVTNGIEAHLSGRLVIDDMQGQLFDNAVRIDKSYDADTLRDIHLWPFWSQAVPVLAYTQSHLDALWLQRVDTGLIDNLFVFGSRSGIRMDQSATEGPDVPGGAPTKTTIGTLHCDATRWCLWITGTNVHLQIDDIDSQGQEFASADAPPRPLPDTAAVRIEGQAVLQIGHVWQEFSDHSTFSFLNNTLASNVQVGSVYEDLSHADANPAHATMRSTTTGQSMLYIAAPPMVVTVGDQHVSAGTAGTNGIVTVR